MVVLLSKASEILKPNASLSIKDNDCYVLFVKDKKVLFEDVLNLSALTEPDINSLKLFIFQLGQDAHLICDEQPSTDDDGSGRSWAYSSTTY